MKLPYGIIEAKRIVLTKNSGKWCRLSYSGHKKGCPNYGRSNCPPNVPFITNILDLAHPTYIAFSEFNLKEHIDRMRTIHPKWSDKQLRNVLYWQGISRKEMRYKAKLAKYYTGANTIIECPEAYGVNVYATCYCSGLKLQKIKNIIICRHIALIGFFNTPPLPNIF